MEIKKVIIWTLELNIIGKIGIQNKLFSRKKRSLVEIDVIKFNCINSGIGYTGRKNLEQVKRRRGSKLCFIAVLFYTFFLV